MSCGISCPLQVHYCIQSARDLRQHQLIRNRKGLNPHMEHTSLSAVCMPFSQSVARIRASTKLKQMFKDHPAKRIFEPGLNFVKTLVAAEERSLTIAGKGCMFQTQAQPLSSCKLHADWTHKLLGFAACLTCEQGEPSSNASQQGCIECIPH